MPSIRRVSREAVDVDITKPKYAVKFYREGAQKEFGFRSRHTIQEAIRAFFRDYNPERSRVGESIDRAVVISQETDKVLCELSREQLMFYFATAKKGE